MSAPQGQSFIAKLGNDEITFETGRIAQLAGGSVIVRSGESVLLVTATASKNVRDGIDFLPLSVEFEEKLYAAGRIPGSFFRREGRPSEDAILICRLVDRPLRPLFNKTIRNEVQVVVTALSSDDEKHLDIMALNGASAALMISDIPWAGPVGAVRIGLIDDELVVNPTIPQMENSALDLRVAGTKDAVLMVEAGANEVSESILLDGLKLAHESIQGIIALQERMRDEIGKAKRDMATPELDPELQARVEAWLNEDDRIAGVLDTSVDKTETNRRKDELTQQLLEAFADDETISAGDLKKAFSNYFKKLVRARVLSEGIRPDGRTPKDIRPIWGEVGVLPRVHGSAIFTRGETQVMSIVTLGTPGEEQRLDTLGPVDTKRYMHHYNFPPYTVGETGRIGGTKRRETGHGALAERALIPVIPDTDEFPYTLRVVSEVMASNGSSSMASVCGSTMSLMDAGVPIKKPVAGIAMGLVTDYESDNFVVLSDIQGVEDALGDMDFKVTGTRDGITALQMDIKISGLAWEIFEIALAQAKDGRFHILDKMAEVIETPRSELAKYAPRIYSIQIDPEKIGKVIGPGGKTIRAIQDETGAKIEISEDGTVFIATDNQEGAQAAQTKIELLTSSPEVGGIYTGTVVRTTDFGAFVEILPGTDGLVHISQLADYRVNSVEDVAKVGDEIMVMVTDISPEGKIRLSRQAVLEGWTPEEARERDQPKRGGRGGDRRGGDRRGGDRRGGNRRDRR